MKLCLCVMVATLAACQVMAPGRGSGPSSATGGGQRSSSGAEPSTNGGNGDMLVMPDVTGKTIDEAQAMLRQAGFRGDIEQSRPVECENRAPVEGRIRCQDPDAGKPAASYALLQVAVYHKSTHYGRVTGEDLAGLRGMTVAQAKAKLIEYGYTGDVSVNYSRFDRPIENCKVETVCSVDHSGDGDGLAIHLNRAQ